MQRPDVREAAKDAADLSKSFMIRQVNERTTQLGVRVESVAHDLRSASTQLRSFSAGPIADYVERGAAVVERVGRYLEQADTDRLVDDFESMTRKRPLAVAAGAAALGFAASRLLKTAGTRRSRDEDATSLGPRISDYHRASATSSRSSASDEWAAP
jgi:hypothetical protein